MKVSMNASVELELVNFVDEVIKDQGNNFNTKGEIVTYALQLLQKEMQK